MPLTPEQHIAESRDAALTAERLFEEGRPLQGAEITWCSVKHAINAIGLQRGFKYDSYRQKKDVVVRLEREERHTGLAAQLAYARRLHVDSDHGLMDVQQIAEARSITATLLERLLTIAAPTQ